MAEAEAEGFVVMVMTEDGDRDADMTGATVDVATCSISGRTSEGSPRQFNQEVCCQAVL